MKSKVKSALRLKSDSFDTEIESLIASARIDLKNHGIKDEKADSLEDPLTLRAIILYTQMNFGIEVSQYDRLKDMYTSLVTHMSMCEDYRHIPSE